MSMSNISVKQVAIKVDSEDHLKFREKVDVTDV